MKESQKEDAAPSAQTHITDEMRALVGREMRRWVSFPVSGSDIRRWAIAVYYPQCPPGRFWDTEAAAVSRYGGIVAPEDFNPFAWMVAQPKGQSTMAAVAGNPDAIENGLHVAGPGLEHALNGGIQIAYGVPMRPGDVITSVITLAEYRERLGSLGLMLFTSIKTVWTNQNGEIVKTGVSTVIRY
jgi:hypothetical protein